MPTVAELMKSFPPDRRREVQRVRQAIRQHLPEGYREGVYSGMLVYFVPLSRYPDTYNGQPLMLAGIASRKSALTLHFIPAYSDPAALRTLRRGFRAAGKKLDMGKGCIHFRVADDLDLETIGGIIADTPVDRWIEATEKARRRGR